MECSNGHKIEGAAKFCPVCGVSLFNAASEPTEVSDASQVEAPRAAATDYSEASQMEAPHAAATEPGKPWFRNGPVVIGIAIVAAAVIIAIGVGASRSSPPATTTTTTTTTIAPIPKGPSVAYMQSTTLSDYNKQEDASGTSSNCTYVPSKWAPGYQFTCFIYNSSNAEIGTVAITSTSSATATQYTWNEAYNPN
jgi:hypothetical protein